jgi:hypothetical protein
MLRPRPRRATGEADPLMREDDVRRPWTAAAAIIVCLELGALPAVAQDASAPPGGSVAVTGTILGMCEVEAGTEALVDGAREWRGWTVTCRESMSDPRVSGSNQHRYNRDCRYPLAAGDADDASPVICIIWSDFVVSGPDGTWEGADRGLVTPDGESDTYRVATGTGAYDGWTYVSHADEGDVSGIIYKGPPPAPWGPLASAPPASPQASQ